MLTYKQEVEGHLLNWYYHERIIMGTTLDGNFIKETALGILQTPTGMIVCCAEHHNWMCPFNEEVNVKAMRTKSVDKELG